MTNSIFLFTFFPQISVMEDLLSEGNPWEVDSIMEFNFFLCPECQYQSKESTSFKIHAIGKKHAFKNYE